jgi:BirA family transcriptional regulator, biotin operon repressor / biotin---[acetyl-CoA-carboxylase] ligase
MHPTGFPFVILKQVDSTNNYAMAMVHAGMAKHGDAWFSNHQTDGKGQRGKSWLTGEGLNIALSVAFIPGKLKIIHPFQLSTAVALAFHDLFSRYAGDETTIKWPNDIYWRDRKAGGILIENKFSGSHWKWAVVGIGVNVNQALFDKGLLNPVSLMQVTGKNFETEELAKELYGDVMNRTSQLLTKSYEVMLEEYNHHLYKIHQPVRLKKDNMVFETLIKGVSPKGQLITRDVMEKKYDFGEVEWLLS